MDLKKQVRLVYGTATGAAHIENTTNGQDAFSIRHCSTSLVIAVADGCGSQPHSEVGAWTVVKMATNFAEQIIRKGLELEKPHILRHLKNRILARIQSLADDMAGEDSVGEVLDTFFQFTLVMMVMTPHKTIFLRLGDGMRGLNTIVTVMEPEKGNAPSYIVYNLTGALDGADPTLLDFVVEAVVPTAQINTFWISTDGIEKMLAAVGETVNGTVITDVETLLADERHHANPHLLGRWLAELAYEGIITDDGTLIAGEVIWPPKPETDPEASTADNTGVTETDEESPAPGKVTADAESASSEESSGTDGPETTDGE